MRRSAGAALERTPVRYLFGLVLAACAFGLRVLLEPYTGVSAPFVLFFGAMLLTSLLAGLGPGLVVLLVTLAMTAITFVVPSGVSATQAIVQLLLYCVDGAIVLLLTRRAQVAQRKMSGANRGLREAEAHTRKIIDGAPDAYLQADLKDRFVDVNDAACRLLGYSRDELLRMSVLDVVADAQRLADVKARLMVPGTVHTSEETLRGKDGGLLPVEVSTNILPDGRWQAFVRDISARKRGEVERREAMERLRHSEEQFRLIFEEAPIGMALIALDGRFLRVNRALCEITGYTAAELEQLTYQEVTAPEDLQASIRLGERARSGQAKYQIEKRYIRKDGRPVTIVVNGSMVTDAEGRPQLYIGQIEDITERKRADEAIRESEAKFRRLMETLPDGVFIAQGWRIVYANASFAALLGYSGAAQLVGKELRQIVATESVAIAEERGRDMEATGKSGPPREMQLLNLDGSSRSVETVAIGIQYEGQPAFLVVVRDLADRKRSEREQRLLAEVGVALAKSLDYEDTLGAVARLAVRDFADWCIVEVTEDVDGLRRLKVVSADPAKEPIARGLEQYRVDRERPYLMKRAVETGQPWIEPQLSGREIERLAQSPDHLQLLRAVAPRSVMVVPLLLRDQLLGTLTFLSSKPSRTYRPEDLRLAQAIAERASLAIENARLYRASLRAAGLRDQVLGVVAHDLRNPLTTIALQAGALQRSAPHPERRSQRHRDAILRSAARMNRLIQDLLDVAVLEAGSLKVARESISTRQLLGEAVELQRELCTAMGLELKLELAPQVPDVLGDYHRLLQVLENLIGNAVKFTEAGGAVSVGATAMESGVLCWVADTGRGMTDDELAHVFERFWQAAAHSGRLGAGLGLPIARGIVEAHGGRMWADSRPGRGSTFHFWIPAAPRLAEPAGETAH